MANTYALIRNVMALMGVCNLITYISTLDYYTNELGIQAPEGSIISLIAGIVLVAPCAINMTYRIWKGRKSNV